MELNQNTLQTIANGDFMPDQSYVIEMAKSLLEEVRVIPRLDGAIREDGKPFYYDIFKNGIKRGDIYHAAYTKAFVVVICNMAWETYPSLYDAEKAVKELLKTC